ncbi:hypothetical protein FB45DRAFT_464058 [Roridomyces roridus]|uniref:Uncharacterized protein n=1 Tax=Roridomyces roridus TaxID=1738132 RepID=A0AAD7B004_9AGAR|nr:hypothetical protein FB45DRAFT_464058 [Roridomyces roridus]
MLASPRGTQDSRLYLLLQHHRCGYSPSPMRLNWVLPLLHLLLFFSSRNAHGSLANLTIDDTDSAYWTFTGDWNALSPTSSCSGCVVHPNPALAYNHTWHDGSLVSGTFTFQGSAVYIYGIDFPSPNGGTAAGSSILFQMDSPSILRFHTYAGTEYVYNSLFFSATDLDSSVTHAVEWVIQVTVGEDDAVQVSSASAAKSSALPVPNVGTPDGEVSTKSSAIGRTSLSGVSTDIGIAASSTSSEQTPAASMTSFPDVSDSGTGRTAAPGSISSAPHKSDSAHRDVVIGAVIGGLSALALLTALAFILLRRRWRLSTSRLPMGAGWQALRRQPTPDTIEPFLLSHANVSMPASRSEKLNPPSNSQQQQSTSSTSSLPQVPPPTVDSAPGVLSVDREVEERLRSLLRAVFVNPSPPAYSNS